MTAVGILGQTKSPNKVAELQRVKQGIVSSAETAKKIAPGLEEETTELAVGLRGEVNRKVIIRLKASTPIDEMFGNDLSEASRKALMDEEVRGNKIKAKTVSAELIRLNGISRKSFDQLGLISAELPLSKVKELSRNDSIAYISSDRSLQSFGHLAKTTGWKNQGIFDAGDADPNTNLNGSVGRIAIIDSGIYDQHEMIRWMSGNISKVKFNKDFTGQNIVGDPYGHGTHVTSMLAGEQNFLNSNYEAAAQGAELINLRVLNSLGQGTSASLIAALDWVVANRTTWNIRVVNMSLGTTAQDSYINDPICIAARHAVNAGIVVVASAGNYGKDAAGNKLFGGIGSPGNEPSVITVGATNTVGTDARYDDSVATYSSRGPTRGLSSASKRCAKIRQPDQTRSRGTGK